MIAIYLNKSKFFAKNFCRRLFSIGCDLAINFVQTLKNQIDEISKDFVNVNVGKEEQTNPAEFQIRLFL